MYFRAGTGGLHLARTRTRTDEDGTDIWLEFGDATHYSLVSIALTVDDAAQLVAAVTAELQALAAATNGAG